MSKSYGYSSACALAVLWTNAAIAHGAHFSALSSFDNTNGAFPWSKLVLASDGNFYGTTQNGGTHTQCASGQGCGTVFKMTTGRKLTTIFDFSGPDGAQSLGALVQGANGNLYGTTSTGGTKVADYPDGAGTVFEVTPGGVLTTLYKFQGPDGAVPEAGLLLASDGNFYGTTASGGDAYGGTLFRITPAGVLTKLWSFDYTQYGVLPDSALVQTKNGDLYGVTEFGGIGTYGTVFRFSTHGKYSVVYSFDFTDGGSPYAALVVASDGNFYGATENGGQYVAYGTIFKLTPRGVLTTLHNFDMADGDVPVGTLVQGADGSFYGTTAYGGKGNYGTLFRISPKGKLETLHNFDSASGAYPYAGLLQAADGTLYGDTFAGGTSTACTYGCGAIFSMSLGSTQHARGSK